MLLKHLCASSIFLTGSISLFVLSVAALERGQSIFHLSVSSLCFCFSTVHLGRVSRGFARVNLCQTSVESLECTLNFAKGVSFPEFEVCTTLEELTHALGFLDTRHFYHDLTHLTTAFEDLDIGLSHTKAVDTLLYHLVRVAHCSLNFLLECSLHLCVCAARSDTIFFKSKREEAAELVGTYFLLVLAHEDIEEVVRRLSSFSLCFSKNLLHFGVFSTTASEVLHHVGHGHFENHVHTALEVET